MQKEYYKIHSLLRMFLFLYMAEVHSLNKQLWKKNAFV